MDFLSRLGSCSPRVKRLVLLAVDSSTMIVALYAAFSLRLGTISPVLPGGGLAWYFVAVFLFGVAIILAFRLPWIRLAAMQSDSVVHFAHAAIALTMMAMAVSYVMQIAVPRSVPLIGGVFFFTSAVLVRALALRMLIALRQKKGAFERVAIYGAGAAGSQVAAALRQSRELQPILFFDDNPALAGLVVTGLPVRSPSQFEKVIKREKIDRILIAMPSAPRSRTRDLIEKLSGLGYRVQAMPSYVDLLLSNEKGGEADGLAAGMLPAETGRVSLHTPEIARTYAGRVVLIAGGAGAIGTELARQLIECRPAAIVLFDRDEKALIDAERSLAETARQGGVRLTARVGDILDQNRTRAVIAEAAPDVVLHAASQMIPTLSTANLLEASRTDVLGTRVLASSARDQGVGLFLMVAKNPADEAGETSRALVLLKEAVARDIGLRSPNMRLGVVRLRADSAGLSNLLSLVKNLSDARLPVRLPDGAMSRKLLSGGDTARLVLTAGAEARVGDVYVIEPDKAVNLGRLVRRFLDMRSPAEFRDMQHQQVTFTGLRPGEDLHEPEAPAAAGEEAGLHPMLRRSEDRILSEIEVAGLLADFQQAVAAGDPARLLAALRAKGLLQPADDPAGIRRGPYAGDVREVERSAAPLSGQGAPELSQAVGGQDEPEGRHG